MKFRVWDKVKKCYLLTSAITSDGDLMLLGQVYGKWNEVSDENKDNYTIEYWTGKQDRNGIDIYDGDILTSTFDNCYELIVVRGDFWFYDIEQKKRKHSCMVAGIPYTTHHYTNLHKLGTIHDA